MQAIFFFFNIMLIMQTGSNNIVSIGNGVQCQ